MWFFLNDVSINFLVLAFVRISADITALSMFRTDTAFTTANAEDQTLDSIEANVWITIY